MNANLQKIKCVSEQYSLLVLISAISSVLGATTI